MPYIKSLLDAIDACDSDGSQAVLATVVKVEGSAYRRPGARMLIPLYGAPIGTISGGCLESEVVKKAWWLTESGPVICAYSTAADDDELSSEPSGEKRYSFGLGCNGTVYILLERLEHPFAIPLLSTLRQVQERGEAAAIATVLKHVGHTGERMTLTANGQFSQPWSLASLTTQVQHDLSLVLEKRKSALHRYVGATEEIEVFLEYIPPARRLVVFGAGHDAQPLVSMASRLGWEVTVIDGRSQFARAERFPQANAVIVADSRAPFACYPQLRGAAVVVMTHSLAQDFQWLKSALLSDAVYIGQLGPKDRTEKLLADIGISADARLHYPIGLDLGGDTPESVALAILAEITAVLNGREGGMLKHRQQTIHELTPSQRIG